MSLVCRICFSGGNHTRYVFREQMFGLGEEFDYFGCVDCGCLQIAHVPRDLSRFYPANYYSFNFQSLPKHWLKSWLAGKRDSWAATGRGLLGFLLNKIVAARPEVAALGGIPTRKEMQILDVGCGRGELLDILHRAGVGRLEGIDPYLASDLEVAPGLCVRKLALEQVSGEFDLIMLHHAFEHAEHGQALLAAAAQRLSAKGKILLRIPTPESTPWERYRENWVGLDAPRHLFLHTRKSLGILAARTGLRIEKCWCDAPAFHFWASELYQKGLALYDKNGRGIDPLKHFTVAQMRDFAQLAKKENASGRGGAIVVVLSKLDPLAKMEPALCRSCPEQKINLNEDDVPRSG
jgi:SAM-dependent methyltransferase